MKTNAAEQKGSNDERTNIKKILEAERDKDKALADAHQRIAEKLAEASAAAETVKEKVINDARSERKKMIQQAIEQAKIESKTAVEKQVQGSEDVLKQGEKWIGDVAEFAVNFILGLNQEQEG